MPARRAQETRNGIRVLHPRYPLLPKVGMTTAPALLAAAALPVLQGCSRAASDFDLIDAHYFYPDGVAAAWLGTAARPAGRHHGPRHRSQSDSAATPCRGG